MRNLHDCVTEQDGTLRISFRRSLSIRETDSDHSRSLSDFQSARNSLSSSSRRNIARQIPSLTSRRIDKQPMFSIPNYDPDDDSEPINLRPRRRPESRPITHMPHVLKTPDHVTQPIHTRGTCPKNPRTNSPTNSFL
ncbi:hypothetical protein Ddye_020537 [Dipteronia dyeriana]|uniref:Uncharacterized protein n=1 Tax=Dipteronia dyeriana TaxID=168575 RepID=A0AAD9U0I3_9ROSI|nr:hypothetical protein Ddye_020537 [Dipteronia dyeriana]